MTIRLRQIALVASDLAAAESAIESALNLSLCYRDPGVATFGLHNALYPIGDKLLEVVSPTEAGTTAGRLLDKRNGDGGYMVILQTDDLDAARSHIETAGARVVFVAEGEGVTGLHLHPRDVGGAILSIDQTDEWAEWPWAGPEWRSHVDTSMVGDIVGVHIAADDPAAMATRWATVLGCPLVDGADHPTIDLDEGRLVFVPVADDRGEGVCAVELAASGAHASVELCGCRFDLVAPS